METDWAQTVSNDFLYVLHAVILLETWNMFIFLFIPVDFIAKNVLRTL